MANQRPPNIPVSRDEYVVARLRQVLCRHKEKSTWRQISKAILDANGGAGNATVDRRTLPRICSDDDFDQVKLSLAQLIALDKYFVLSDEGPLFARHRSLIDTIAESNAVVFYVAAKYHKALYTDAVSAFDLRAIMTFLTTRLGRLDLRINDISNMKDWHKAKTDNQMIAQVSIGSPIANDASDAMLSGMLGFNVNKNTRPDRLPFFFVRRRRERNLPSGFVRKKLDAVTRNAPIADAITADERALVIEDRVFVANDRTDFALLAAQRNPDSGQVRAVISGLAGIGTLELARILQAGKPAVELPELRKKETHPPILVAVYKFTLEGRRSKVKNGKDSRKIVGSAPIFGPLFLNYSDGAWRSVAGAPPAR